MACTQMEDAWPDYFAANLDEPKRRQVETHLDECARCSERREGLQLVWDRLDDLPLEAPPAGLRPMPDAALVAFQEREHAWNPAIDGRDGETGRRAASGFWRWRVLARVGPTLAATMGALALGFYLGGPVRSDERLLALEDEVRGLRQLVALSMLEQRSAIQRLRGVTFSSQLRQPEPEVLSTLLDTLNYDPNPRISKISGVRSTGIEDMQALIEQNGGQMVELREPEPHVPPRVATFRDSEGNGFELRQYVSVSSDA